MKEINIYASTLKMLRKKYHMTQKEMSIKTGLGLRFIRELEQGKITLKLDKVLQAFALFNFTLIPEYKKDKINYE